MEPASEPAPVRAAEGVYRPVSPAEASGREHWRRNTGEERAAEEQPLQTDPRIEQFIAYTEQARQGRLRADTSGGERIEKLTGGSAGFDDLFSALQYWESLEPQREDTSDLPAPIAAYREVEAGPPPRLGLSTYA